MHVKNVPVVLRNETILNKLNFEVCSNIQEAGKFLWLKIGAKTMLTININVQVLLINDQVEQVSYIGIVRSIVQKVYVTFSDSQAGLKVITPKISAGNTE